MQAPTTTAIEKVKSRSRQKCKNAPKLISAARELRDRWIEQVNASNLIGQGKYDVSRVIARTDKSDSQAAVASPNPSETRQLAA